VYQQVALQNEAVRKGAAQPIVITVSVDEKPGVQAIGNTAPDLPPVAGKYPTASHRGPAIMSTSAMALGQFWRVWTCTTGTSRHASRSGTGVWSSSPCLQDLDAYYPPECTIRLILDNHSSHISRETRAYLATRPNRFKYVLTPAHGSWLNIVETLFGKMTRTFLRQIRVQSRAELKSVFCWVSQKSTRCQWSIAGSVELLEATSEAAS